MIRTATTEDDLSACATTFWRAFADDPVMRWLFPSDDDYASDGRAVEAWLVRRFHSLGSLWCTDDGVAMAGWIPPGRPEPSVPPPPPNPPIDHPEDRRLRMDALSAAVDAHQPAEPHWYLNVLATHPDWQRRGLGSALLGVGFALGDEAGVPCYLETETLGLVAYYRSHGFEVRSEWDVDDTGPHMWGMIRPPAEGGR